MCDPGSDNYIFNTQGASLKMSAHGPGNEKLGRKAQQNAGGAEVYHWSLESQAETVSLPVSSGLEEPVMDTATFKHFNQQGGTYHTKFTASGHAKVSLGNNLTINNYGIGSKNDVGHNEVRSRGNDSSWTVKSKIPKKSCVMYTWLTLSSFVQKASFRRNAVATCSASESTHHRRNLPVVIRDGRIQSVGESVRA